MKYVYKKRHVRALMSLYDIWGNLTTKKTPKRENEPKQIGLVILHQIGDVIMTLPTIETIHGFFPSSEVTLILGKTTQPLFQDNPWKAKTKTFDPAWQKVVRQLNQAEKDVQSVQESKQEFLNLLSALNLDLIVIFHPDLIINQLIGKTKIPYSFGFANAGGGFHITHPISLAQTGHQVERNYDLARSIGSFFDKKVPVLNPPHYWVDQDSKRSVLDILKTNHIETKKLVVLHPFASAATKNWLPENWLTIITWLKDKSFDPVIIGQANDNLGLDHVGFDLTGQLSLLQSAALLSLAQLFIGIDSGPGHIAAALGCPVVSIFSSAHDEKRWAPVGKEVITLYKTVDDRKKFPYELRDLPPGTQGNPYTDKITPNDVIKAAEHFL